MGSISNGYEAGVVLMVGVCIAFLIFLLRQVARMK